MISEWIQKKSCSEVNELNSICPAMVTFFTDIGIWCAKAKGQSQKKRHRTRTRHGSSSGQTTAIKSETTCLFYKWIERARKESFDQKKLVKGITTKRLKLFHSSSSPFSWRRLIPKKASSTLFAFEFFSLLSVWEIASKLSLGLSSRNGSEIRSRKLESALKSSF